MKKPIWRLAVYILIVYCILAISGCGGKTYNGKELVDKAKSLHTGLEAAHITVTDTSDSNAPVVVQEIWYRFSGEIMQYMYIGRDADTGEEYYEFNNGTELDTWHTGDADWSFAARGSDGYYNYSRASRHYFADGEKLLNDYAAAVSDASITDGDEKQVNIVYFTDMVKYYSSMEGVTGYEASYFIGADGYCTEQVLSYNKDGRFYRYEVKTERTDPNVQIELKIPAALSESGEK